MKGDAVVDAHIIHTPRVRPGGAGKHRRLAGEPTPEQRRERRRKNKAARRARARNRRRS